VGSNDLTLVNLQLTALALPGAENSSKNHSDGHRLLNFALTLQETLKGRDLYLCGWATLPQCRKWCLFPDISVTSDL
jgi:hypothetical protein